jgi:hypothetical protein
MPRATRPLIAVLAATLMLGACGPSRTDIEAAMQASLGTTNGVVTGLLGQSARIEISDVTRLGCEKHSPASYRCDVEWTTAVPVFGASRHTDTLVFIRGSGGWTVAR